MEEPTKLYKMNAVYKFIEMYFAYESTVEGCTRVSSYKCDNSRIGKLVESKEIYGENPTYFMTEKEALDEYVADSMQDIKEVTDKYNSLIH